MRLHSYFRSSAAYRVRIALNTKQLAYDYIPVHLLKNGGEQLSEAYRRLNPNALVPTFVDGEVTISESLAIIEYLEEVYPAHPVLPSAAGARARVRNIAQTIACDIHPVNNLRVLKYLKQELHVDDDVKNAWYKHWTELGLAAVEAMLAGDPATGRFCHGDTPTMADFCLVPQLYNARRFNCDLSAMPNLVRIDAACRALDAFARAEPECQPDAESVGAAGTAK